MNKLVDAFLLYRLGRIDSLPFRKAPRITKRKEKKPKVPVDRVVWHGSQGTYVKEVHGPIGLHGHLKAWSE